MSRMYNPAHPGEVLREYLPEGMSISEAAKRLGVSRVQLSRLVNARAAMTAEMAIRIAMFTGSSAESWLKNQVQWDLWQAEQKPRPHVEPYPRAA
jgi:addiction module HigA family antidote